MSGTGVDGSPITRDANGRITGMIEYVNGVTHSWAITYDARSRLESVVRDGTTTTYEYVTVHGLRDAAALVGPFRTV
jgi:hypothetical protein